MAENMNSGAETGSGWHFSLRDKRYRFVL